MRHRGKRSRVQFTWRDKVFATVVILAAMLLMGLLMWWMSGHPVD